MNKEHSKPLLIFSSVILSLLSLALLGLGSYGTQKGFFSFVLGTAIFMGISLFIVAIVNAFATTLTSNKLLIVSYVCMLFLTLFIVFLVIGAFVFSGKLSRKIEADWQSIAANYNPPLTTQNQVYTIVQDNAFAIGGLSFIALLFMVLSLKCTANILGYDYSRKRMLKVANYFTTIIGFVMLILAAVFAFEQVGGAWMPQVIVAIGIIIIITSIIGYWGTKRESRLFLRIYFFTVLILAVTLFSVGVYTLVDGDSILNFVSDNWAEVSKTLPKDTSEPQFLDFLDRNFTLLGCVAIATFVFMIFNEVIAFLLLRELGGMIHTTQRQKGGDNVMDLRKSNDGI